jgi:hypothetical protein
VDDIKTSADFGLTWDGFFLKSRHKINGSYDINDKGYIEIDSQEDFRVIGSNGTSEVIKIGLLGKDDSGYNYGIRIKNLSGTTVFETDKNGNLKIEGAMTATGGKIGKWNIIDGNLSSVEGAEGIILDADKSQIYSQKYYTSNYGNGWMINNNEAIFNNITLRGSLKCAVLEYAEVSAIGGIMMVRPATTIKKAEYSDSYTTASGKVYTNTLLLTVKNSSSFKSGDWCKLTTEAANDVVEKENG